MPPGIPAAQASNGFAARAPGPPGAGLQTGAHPQPPPPVGNPIRSAGGTGEAEVVPDAVGAWVVVAEGVAVALAVAVAVAVVVVASSGGDFTSVFSFEHPSDKPIAISTRIRIRSRCIGRW